MYFKKVVRQILLSLFIFLFASPLSVLPAYAQGNGNAQNVVKKPNQAVCGKVKDEFNCHSHVVTNEKGKPDVTFSPHGLGPAQFTGAYGVSGITSTNQTIAIVDAYDHPYAFQDLNTYSNYFGLQTMASCPVTQGTTSRPCFQKVNQNGQSFYPQRNSGWALEIALNIEAAHAMCQNCNILLVEASSASYNNLMAAVDRAVTMGAKVVSNSYGSNEFSGETTYDPHFNKPGVAFTFSSGDSGYGASYPAASRYVTAVGGTTLFVDSNNSYVGETVWNGAGSGCSAYESKPSWQTDTGCSKRTIADVSADADPNTGAAVYDSYPYQGFKGWFQVGGTSLAAPIVAATYALAGIPSGVMANSLPYSNSTGLHDIISGTNGSCGGTYLCTGLTGYDGPTGLGSPNGLLAF